ncbi:Asnovolin E/Chermesin D methyltransferase nvfJ [Fulvia fulva]|nr:Asnovolin E/Chermesin D methyltransferase nvfJ [Fulvia fulva]
MASMPARRSSQRRPSRPDQAPRSTSRPSQSPARTRSEDSQTIFVNKPDQEEKPQTQQPSSTFPLPQDDAEPKKCWICFSDSTEDTPETSRWRNPCPCALEAHEECLLDWIADMEAPKNQRGRPGLAAPKIECPQCKSEIKLSRPRDYLVDFYRGIERLGAKAVTPGSLALLSGVVYNFSLAHGMHSIYAIFGSDDGQRILRPVIYNATRAPVEAYAGHPGEASEQLLNVLIDHIVHWRLYVGLPLITPILVLSRTSFADGVLPVLPIIFFASQAHSPNEFIDFAQWPPSASFAFAVLPYFRSLYNYYYKKVWAEREKQWLRAIQPRINETQTDANGEVVDVGDEGQPADNGDGNVFEVRIDGGIWDDWENEDQIEQAIAANNAMAQPDQAAQDGDEGAPGPVVQDNRPVPEGGANEAPAQQAGARQQAQQQQNQQNQPAGGERRLSFSPTAIAETVLGALIFPTLAGFAGEALKLILPSAWTAGRPPIDVFRQTQFLSNPRFRGLQKTGIAGLLQHKWARSLVGGCLLVVCKDALTLYGRTKRYMSSQDLHDAFTSQAKHTVDNSILPKMPDIWKDFNGLLIDDPSFKLTPEVRELFVKYAGIPEDEVVQHVKDVRDRAFKIFPYPCIGQYRFLDFGVSTAPKYNDVLAGVKGGKTLLDLGCCFGQDLRKLVHDGAASANLTGFEMEKDFTELGYDLFRDRETLRSTFVHGDVFASTPNLTEGSFDYVHASSFFHLFSWAEQVELVRKTLKLLNPVKGSMVFGRQAGVKEPGVLKHERTRSGEMFRHDEGSFERMVHEAVEGMEEKERVEVEVEVGMFEVEVEGGKWDFMHYGVVVK